MAIKSNGTTKKVIGGIKPVIKKAPQIIEKEEVDFDDEFLNDEEESLEESVLQEDPIVDSIIEEIHKPVVSKKPVSSTISSKKVNTVSSVKKVSPAKSSTKKTLGRSTPKKEKKDTIGNVYSRERLTNDVQARLDEIYEGISKKDTDTIIKIVEEEIYRAVTENKASLRIFGGLLRTTHKAPSVSKLPNAKEYYYTSERDDLVLIKSHVTEVEKYIGYYDDVNKTFEAIGKKETNPETGKQEYIEIEPVSFSVKKEEQ